MYITAINHQSDAPIFILRSDYITICEGNHCAAAILNQMEYWYSIRIGNRPQAEIYNTAAKGEGLPSTQVTDLWVYKSGDDMQAELLNAYGREAVRTAFTYLVKRKYLLERTNPEFRWDKTKQYLFQVATVQAAVNCLPVPSPKIGSSKTRNQGFDDPKSGLQKPNNGAAIPETTTETLTEKRTLRAPAIKSALDTEGEDDAWEVEETMNIFIRQGYSKDVILSAIDAAKGEARRKGIKPRKLWSWVERTIKPVAASFANRPTNGETLLGGPSEHSPTDAELGIRRRIDPAKYGI